MTSLDDVRGMFTRYVCAVNRAGIDASGYRLRVGDSVNAWRVFDTANGSQAPALGVGGYGYIGDNRREAYRALFVMASVLEDLRYMAEREERAAELEAAK